MPPHRRTTNRVQWRRRTTATRSRPTTSAYPYPTPSTTRRAENNTTLTSSSQNQSLRNNVNGRSRRFFNSTSPYGGSNAAGNPILTFIYNETTGCLSLGVRIQLLSGDGEIDQNLSFEERRLIERDLEERVVGFSDVDQLMMNGGDDSEVCAICLDELLRINYHEEEKELNMKIVELECKHKYHAECIKNWVMRMNFCPLCKSQAVFN